MIWTRCDDRLPRPDESPNGYFWCWSGDVPEMLEAWERDGVPQGFCHEGGQVRGVTHWAPAIPPASPVEATE